MAIIKNQKTFVAAVGTIVNVDMGVIVDLFPVPQYHTTEEIEYDSATVEGVAPEYNAFSSTAKVIKKDGKDIVNLKPVQFNNAISKETIDAEATKFGQNEYGEGTIDPTMQSALNGVGKLHLNRLVGTKAIVYEALATGKIVGGYVGVNGVEDIVFPVPAANKEIFDGTAKKYWSNVANANPAEDIYRAVKAMKVKPTRIIMNDDTYTNFLASPHIAQIDNTTTGVKRNFVLNENVDPNADYFRAGRFMYRGVSIDVYVERGQRRLSNGSYVPFMPAGYVVYASPVGEMHYGGIPIAENGGIRKIAAEYDVREVVTIDPPQHNLIYKSAPLPVLKNGQAYYSQKVEA